MKDRSYLWMILPLALTLTACSDKRDDGKDQKGSGDQTEVTECSALTKDGNAACLKADAVKGKICVWEFDECSELSSAVKKFRAQNISFAAAVPAGPANLATDQILGADHGERPNWDLLCGVAPANNLLNAVVNNVRVNFKKDKQEVDVVLDCTRGGGVNNKTYTFGYDAKALADGALLLRLDAKTEKVDGDFLGGGAGKNGNQLDFFSKADWLYSAKNSKLMVIPQLAKLGFDYQTIPLTTEKSFSDAFTYARTTGNGYEVADNVGSTSMFMSKL